MKEPFRSRMAEAVESSDVTGFVQLQLARTRAKQKLLVPRPCFKMEPRPLVGPR